MSIALVVLTLGVGVTSTFKFDSYSIDSGLVEIVPYCLVLGCIFFLYRLDTEIELFSDETRNKLYVSRDYKFTLAVAFASICIFSVVEYVRSWFGAPHLANCWEIGVLIGFPIAVFRQSSEFAWVYVFGRRSMKFWIIFTIFVSAFTLIWAAVVHSENVVKIAGIAGSAFILFVFPGEYFRAK
jgi:hypothetical protein